MAARRGARYAVVQALMEQRRSRMRRTRRGKRLELTQRDFEIFQLLYRYRYLSSAYIHAFVGGASVTRFKERLGDLFHEGYLDRPEKQWELADCRHRPAIYEIGRGGLNALLDNGVEQPEPSIWLGLRAHRQFLHSLMICEVLASIELEAQLSPHLRFIPWPEILARTPEATRTSAAPYCIPITAGAVIPDGLFGLEYRSGSKTAYRFFAIEVDRGTMPVIRSCAGQTSYLGKLAAYQKIIMHKVYKDHLGVPNLFVLTVTMDSRRLSAILAKLDSFERSPFFLFKAADTSMLTHPSRCLLAEPWERAQFPRFNIDE